ncbi:dnaJ homolog subfamily A member 3, mitochondrial-like [Benincasa hispida]|uniref:dnaJ homolog subfamily A member 3, mitochondrial-like n=1 Tax=Benincasa hispida TaxID=102211 RepID=UPI00190195E9|nr:dnaJ homolog subfamily A member 3, mitochondrial-like [Benincasa hispida]
MFASPNSSSNSLALFFPSKTITTAPPTAMAACRFSCKAAAVAAAPKERDYYKLLSVSGGCNASNEEIKKAYRAMALQYHPDLVCDPLLKEQSTRIFVQLNAAYKTLSDPVLRRQYDASLMGFNNNGFSNGRRGFQADTTVWQRQLLELKRRSALRRDRSAKASWGATMQARSF